MKRAVTDYLLFLIDSGLSTYVCAVVSVRLLQVRLLEMLLLEIQTVARVNRDKVIAGLASMPLSNLLQWGTSTPFA